MKQKLSPHLKEKISEAESKLILKKISNVFIESKGDIIISKKYFPIVVAADYPLITFEIYIKGKKIVKKYIVGKRQGNYEITYSESFSNLYNNYLKKQKIYLNKVYFYQGKE